jgi:hypothetical protein
VHEVPERAIRRAWRIVPASFRDCERAVILSSLSGTVVARDEFLPVWADVEAAMELDLLGVAVRAASKERSSTIKRFQPCEVTSWGDGASCWVIVWGVGARCCPGAWAHAWSRLEPAR